MRVPIALATVVFAIAVGPLWARAPHRSNIVVIFADLAAAHSDVVAELIGAANAHRRTVAATKPLFDVLLPKPGGR